MNKIYVHAFSEIENCSEIRKLAYEYATNTFKYYLKSKSKNNKDYEFNKFNQEDIDVLINLYVSAYEHICKTFTNNNTEK